MKRGSDTGLALAVAGMEFSWIYALATFITDPILKGPYPLPDAVAAFAFSAGMTAYIRGKGWRIVQILLAHGFALLFYVSRTVHFLFYRDQSFWSRMWLTEFHSLSLDRVQGFFMFVLVLWTLFFWIAGVRLAVRSRSYLAVCTRFDLGFACFFGIMIIKLLLRVQLKIPTTEMVSEDMMYAFFVFGLLAVALARNRSGTRKVFLTGYRGIGLLFSFSLGILFFGTGSIVLFLPYLKVASQAGYEVLQAALKPLVPVLTELIRIFFMIGRERPAEPGALTAPGGSPASGIGETAGWLEGVFTIVAWGFAGLLVLVLTVFVLIGAWFLVRWLFSRTAADERRSTERPVFFGWLERWVALLFRIYDSLFDRSDRQRPFAFYQSLLRWGRRSGLPQRFSETPLEYGARLKRRFHLVGREIDVIVAIYNRFAYRNTVPDRVQTIGAQAALRKIQSPLLWPHRLKTRLLAME